MELGPWLVSFSLSRRLFIIVHGRIAARIAVEELLPPLALLAALADLGLLHCQIRGFIEVDSSKSTAVWRRFRGHDGGVLADGGLCCLLGRHLVCRSLRFHLLAQKGDILDALQLGGVAKKPKTKRQRSDNERDKSRCPHSRGVILSLLPKNARAPRYSQSHEVKTAKNTLYWHVCTYW